MTDRELLRRAAQRAGQQPFFLAWSLLAYARAEGLDDDGLAAALGCDPASLPALLLCRRPEGEGAVFRADVEAIAERFRLDAARLARLIRTADTVVAWAWAATDQVGGLLAARDRDADDRQPGREPAEPTSPGVPPEAASADAPSAEDLR